MYISPGEDQSTAQKMLIEANEKKVKEWRKVSNTKHKFFDAEALKSSPRLRGTRCVCIWLGYLEFTNYLSG